MSVNTTLLPFLYPASTRQLLTRPTYLLQRSSRRLLVPRKAAAASRCVYSIAVEAEPTTDDSEAFTLLHRQSQDDRAAHLNPSPDSYSTTPFTDRCQITISAGAGGHGCISFLREKYIPNGPANGGDGGTGGSIYIQAVRGETSLHKLARRGILKASRGKNGQGKNQGGERGEDIVIQVPVGTIIREIWRHDPLDAEEAEYRLSKGFGADAKRQSEEAAEARPDQSSKWRRDKWLLYPGALPAAFTTADFPALPRPRRSNLSMTQPAAPLRLDLDKPMESPILLAAGAMGGLGNPHFVTKSIPRPKYATKGEDAMRLEVQLELKLLADVGLVGLPNAGKSTLLRALSNSRARVGSWAFTTLQPNVGTVVLDDHKGRPSLSLAASARGQRTNFTIADIPGLVQDAHLDKGLGLGFLRHIERAGILAFVVDLSAGDAVIALQGLWKEVGHYEALRDRELNADTERRIEGEKGIVQFNRFKSRISPQFDDEAAPGDDSVVLERPEGRDLPPLLMPPISNKPWLVVATKADLPSSQENFAALKSYLEGVETGTALHPSGKKNAWRRKVHAIPVSAINGEGVQAIPAVIVDLLDD